MEIIWPTSADPHQPAFDAMVAERLGELPSPTTVAEARQYREEGLSVFPARDPLDSAEDQWIQGPEGALRLRVLRPSDGAIGVYLHVHGGGWILGRPHHVDAINQRLADATGLIVVSPYYRLAPEDPYPAAPDDVEAAATWLADHADSEFGVPLTAVGGESAGAHLAAVTMIRMRDRHGYRGFRAANLAYGVFDLSGTPSVRSFGDPPVTFGQTALEWMIGNFAGSADLTDPDVSPLHATLDGLAPTLFTVGTSDPLLDDSLFMASRWAAAGNHTTLAVHPGAHHAFDYFDTEQARTARDRMHGFLRGEGRGETGEGRREKGEGRREKGT